MSKRVHLKCCRGPRYTSGNHLGLRENIDISGQKTVKNLFFNIRKIICCNNDVQLNRWLCFFCCFSMAFVLNHNFSDRQDRFGSVRPGILPFFSLCNYCTWHQVRQKTSAVVSSSVPARRYYRKTCDNCYKRVC